MWYFEMTSKAKNNEVAGDGPDYTSNRIANFKMDAKIGVEVDISSGTFYAFKNPVFVDLDLPSGHFQAKISTPISEDDFNKIMETIRSMIFRGECTAQFEPPFQFDPKTMKIFK